MGGTAQKGSRVYPTVARGFQICPQSPPPVKAGQRLRIYLTQGPWCGTHPIPPPQAPVPPCAPGAHAPHPHICTLALHPLHPSGAERPDKDTWGEASRQPPHPSSPAGTGPELLCRSQTSAAAVEGWKLWSHFTDEETKAQREPGGRSPAQPFGP